MIIGLGLVATATAFDVQTTDSGVLLSWLDLPATWVYAPEGAPPEVVAEPALNAAFDTWSLVDGSRAQFVEGTATPTAASQADAANTVWWDTSGETVGDTLAFTSTWSDDNGILVAFDIALNPAFSWAAGDYDLQSTVSHEIGHALGLGHSAEVDAVMFPTLTDGTTVRELALDDEEAVRFLYPDVLFDPLACNTATGAPIPLSVLILLAIRRRSR